MSAASGEKGVFARDPLAAALLPVLLHRIHNATQLLGTLNSMVVETGDASWLERRAGDLAAAGETVEELGYALAVLASACGADLLLERREARGLEILCTAARDALRRQGRDLRAPEGELPDMAPDVGRGWELPWSIAATLVAGAAGTREDAGPSWSLAPGSEGWELHIAAAPSAALEALLPLLHERLPGCGIEARGNSFTIHLPGPWLRARPVR